MDTTTTMDTTDISTSTTTYSIYPNVTIRTNDSHTDSGKETTQFTQTTNINTTETTETTQTTQTTQTDSDPGDINTEGTTTTTAGVTTTTKNTSAANTMQKITIFDFALFVIFISAIR